MTVDAAARRHPGRLLQHSRVRRRRRPARSGARRGRAPRDRRRHHRPAGGRRPPERHQRVACRWSISRRRSAITRSPARRCSAWAANTATRCSRGAACSTSAKVDLTVYRREPRGALDVDLDIDGRTVRVVVTHLGLLPGERRKQVRRLLDVLGDEPLRRRRLVRRHQRMVRGRASPALAARAPGTHRRRRRPFLPHFRYSRWIASGFTRARRWRTLTAHASPIAAAGIGSPAAAGRYPPAIGAELG